MRGGVNAFGALSVALCLPTLFSRTCAIAAEQDSPQERLSAGTILVANEKLGDPNFTEAVVLIVQFDKENGSVGLIINRQTAIPVSRVFPKAKQAAKDPVYVGGPLEITGVQALLRLPEKVNAAMHVTGDIYATASEELIEKSVASQADPSKFRLYLGYAGWAPRQLEAEIQIGAWSLISGDAGVIFDRDPASLWSRLSHSQIAMEPLRYFWNSRPAVRPEISGLFQYCKRRVDPKESLPGGTNKDFQRCGARPAHRFKESTYIRPASLNSVGGYYAASTQRVDMLD